MDGAGRFAVMKDTRMRKHGVKDKPRCVAWKMEPPGLVSFYMKLKPPGKTKSCPRSHHLLWGLEPFPHRPKLQLRGDPGGSLRSQADALWLL